MGYLMSPDPTGGGSLLGDIGGLAMGVGSIISAIKGGGNAYSAYPNYYAEPTYGQATPTSIFDIPGYNVQSPIISESAANQQAAMQKMMTPFVMPTASVSARPHLFVTPNPVTGKATFFAPVRITGVKPYNTGIRHRRRCAPVRRRKR